MNDPTQRTPQPDAERTTIEEAVPALVQRFPDAARRLPWLSLGTFPTPVEPLELPGLAGEDLWIKRDDRSGNAYGGNKVRKLEHLLARARRDGVTRLITAGATGSHHALATMVYGRALGFDVTLVLFPQPLTDHVRKVLLLDQALGAELRWASRMETLPIGLFAARRAHRRERCRVVPPGGSDSIGTLGYVDAGLELAAQVAAGEAPRPHTVHVAAGTLGTAAGLALGFTLAGLETRIRAVRIASRLVTHRRALRRLLAGTARLLQDAGIPASPETALARIELTHEQFGAGYGHPTTAAERAAETFGAAGIRLDPTYTAKAAADFLTATDRRAAGARAAGPRLFWHTLSASEPAGDVAGGAFEALPPPFRRYLEAGDA